MRNNFKQEIDTRLKGLEWHGEAEVLRRIRRPQRPARLRTVVIITALLALLCFTAVALTLQYSARYDSLRQARSALSARYGLTDEMLDLFAAQIEETADGTLVRFEPLNLNLDAMGVYTVTRTKEGRLLAAWSHDGADTALRDDLGAEVWGAAQLETALRLRRAHAENWSSDALALYEELTLEERAALDAPLLDGKESVPYINILPEAGDLTPAEAETLALAAIRQKYGPAEEALKEYNVSLSFLLCTMENIREYQLELYAPGATASRYYVCLASPSGEVTRCNWYVAPENRTLPEGDLAQYREAVREYALSGAFELLSAEEKARTAARIKEAGLGALLPEDDYLALESTDISEAQARSAAQDAMGRLYSIAPDALSTFFAPRTALLLGNGQRVWQICYVPTEQPNWRWADFEKLGTYTVTLSAADGGVVSCAWSLEGVDEGAYTEQTFGAAQAYSAEMLPWIQELLADLQAILDAYPKDINLGELTLEDDAAYAARLRAAGYKQTYSHTLPSETDISQEEALILARQALETEYRIEKKTLDSCNVLVSCILREEQTEQADKFWVIDFLLDLDRYTVWLFTDTGMVESIYHDSPASGNG